MGFSLAVLQKQSLVAAERAKQELRACNELSQRFGLMLSEESIEELIRLREEALQASGRVEFRGGILPKIIEAFCDSPYLSQDTYPEILAELQEAFYYFKTDAEERYTDEELIEYMHSVFHGRAQGSAEYLIGTSLEELCRYARQGFDPLDGGQAGDLF